MALKSIPNDPPKRIQPGAFPPVFHETKRYKRPVEVWPVEFEKLEELAFATEELARLELERPDTSCGHALKAVADRLMDLLELWQGRYQEQSKAQK